MCLNNIQFMKFYLSTLKKNTSKLAACIHRIVGLTESKQWANFRGRLERKLKINEENMKGL